MLLLTEADVRRFLPMNDAIEMMRVAFRELAESRGVNQPRRRMLLPGPAGLQQMAGACGAYFGTKIYSFHMSHGVWFLVLLYDAATAKPLAIIEANYLGQIRTGAATGLAAELLAAPDASSAGIIGSGFQARSQLEAVLAIRPTIRNAYVWSRSEARREAFARECREAFGLEVRAAHSAEEAVRDHQIVITATNAKDPVLEAGWVSPGTFVSAMGSNAANRCELPANLLRCAKMIVVDSVEQAGIEAGDLLLGLPEPSWKDLYELKDVLRNPPPYNPNDVRIFKSVGLGIEDVAVAGLVYERATQTGVGVDAPVFYS